MVPTASSPSASRTRWLTISRPVVVEIGLTFFPLARSWRAKTGRELRALELLPSISARAERYSLIALKLRREKRKTASRLPLPMITARLSCQSISPRRRLHASCTRKPVSAKVSRKARSRRFIKWSISLLVSCWFRLAAYSRTVSISYLGNCGKRIPGLRARCLMSNRTLGRLICAKSSPARYS